MPLTGILQEHQHMSEKAVGTNCESERAFALAAEWNIQVIGTRWVLNRKLRHSTEGTTEEVRARCVVQGVRDSQSATSLGFSSPTTTTKALKLILTLAAGEGMVSEQ
eukprot:Skav202269  [mRNA]  locus=scaffold1687:103516:103836:- [translate_table: standard]